MKRQCPDRAPGGFGPMMETGFSRAIALSISQPATTRRCRR
jgi:hypothetical protein